jgi:predicted amidophosphoribosyltransferase
LAGLTPEPGPVRNEGQALLCPACRDKTYAFERARSFAVYEGALVQAILLLKYELIEPLGAWFAEQLAELVKEHGGALAADVVVPVPLHRQRNASAGTTRRRCFRSRWRSGWDCRIKPCC